MDGNALSLTKHPKIMIIVLVIGIVVVIVKIVMVILSITESIPPTPQPESQFSPSLHPNPVLSSRSISKSSVHGFGVRVVEG